MKKTGIILIVLIFFISCKKQESFELKKCFKKEYLGIFNNSKIQMIIDEVKTNRDNSSYDIKGKTIHKDTSVPFLGVLKLADSINNTKTLHLKYTYMFKEKEMEHGSGNFSGYTLIEVQNNKNDYNYKKSKVKFIGNYIFPSGQQFPCSFNVK